MRELVSTHGLVADDIFGKTRSAKSGVKVAVKFRDGENTWSGRGIKPSGLQAHLDAAEISANLPSDSLGRFKEREPKAPFSM